MIDALLGEEEDEEGKEMEMLHCSLDSIDRLGDSLTLSSPPSLSSLRKKGGKQLAAVESGCNLSLPG